jgi:hypothetical protein
MTEETRQETAMHWLRADAWSADRLLTELDSASPVATPAPTDEEAAWGAFVRAAIQWAEHMDQWEKFQFGTEHGQVYVKITRQTTDPGSYDHVMPSDYIGAPERPSDSAPRDAAADISTHDPGVAALAGGASFQVRVHEWVVACFGEEIAQDKIERNHRFLEEALELVQSCGCTQSEAYQLVDYVFGRPVGDPTQEVGGVMNTLAALCTPHGLDLGAAAEKELARCWTKVERIRAKQKAKPKHSPLPGPSEPPPLPPWSAETSGLFRAQAVAIAAICDRLRLDHDFAAMTKAIAAAFPETPDAG